MYPPKFNLRHFMSHLAPGGYYFIQLLYFVVFIIWLLYPAPINNIFDYMTNNNGIVLSFVFIVFGVFCYFVGVVLRLPSVNIINNISIETNIRKIYYELKLKRVFDKTAISVIWCEFRQLLHLSFKIIYLWPSPITTKRACRKIEKIQKKYERRNESNALVDGLYKELFDEFKKQTGNEPKEGTKYERKELLQDFIRQKGAKLLESIANIKPEDYKKNPTEQSANKWILHSLWAVDRFPYPLWISIKAFQIIKSKQKQSTEESDFEKYVWPELIVTMRGNISDNNPWTVPFNRCKLFVKSRSLELASDIYDREAITRMMAGFHQGLRLGSLTSLFIFSVCFILSIKGMPCCGLPLQEYEDTNIEKSLICLIIISAFFFLFNRYHLLKIEENFHILRMSESEAVFDSYIIAKSLPIDQTRNTISSEL